VGADFKTAGDVSTQAEKVKDSSAFPFTLRSGAGGAEGFYFMFLS